jgi:hypothetical protein
MAMEPTKPLDGEIDKPKRNGRKLAVVEPAQPPAALSGDAWQQMIERMAPVVGIDGIKELIKLRREEQLIVAEREFNADMSKAQAELVPVARNKRNKQTNSNYADIAAISEEAMPVIYANGFGVITSEFESKKPDHLGVAIEVTHRSGHSKRYEFNIPWDGAGMKGNANKTPTHAYASTLAYGERYAKCKVFGIATKDDDGNAASASDGVLNEAQFAEIDKLVKATNTNVAMFCRMYGVDTIEAIPATQYGPAKTFLEIKQERQAL